jgi:hypothetical protein
VRARVCVPQACIASGKNHQNLLKILVSVFHAMTHFFLQKRVLFFDTSMPFYFMT